MSNRREEANRCSLWESGIPYSHQYALSPWVLKPVWDQSPPLSGLQARYDPVHVPWQKHSPRNIADLATIKQSADNCYNNICAYIDFLVLLSSTASSGLLQTWWQLLENDQSIRFMLRIK